MVIVSIAGRLCEFRLMNTPAGTRLVRRFASYDLVGMIRDAGWRIHAVESDTERRLLTRFVKKNRLRELDCFAKDAPCERPKTAHRTTRPLTSTRLDQDQHP
jgi:hypothetical protein